MIAMQCWTPSLPLYIQPALRASNSDRSKAYEEKCEQVFEILSRKLLHEKRHEFVKFDVHVLSHVFLHVMSYLLHLDTISEGIFDIVNRAVYIAEWKSKNAPDIVFQVLLQTCRGTLRCCIDVVQTNGLKLHF